MAEEHKAMLGSRESDIEPPRLIDKAHTAVASTHKRQNDKIFFTPLRRIGRQAFYVCHASRTRRSEQPDDVLLLRCVKRENTHRRWVGATLEEELRKCNSDTGLSPVKARSARGSSFLDGLNMQHEARVLFLRPWERDLGREPIRRDRVKKAALVKLRRRECRDRRMHAILLEESDTGIPPRNELLKHRAVEATRIQVSRAPGRAKLLMISYQRQLFTPVDKRHERFRDRGLSCLVHDLVLECPGGEPFVPRD